MSFRSLGRRDGVDASTSYRRYQKELLDLQCIDVTRTYCSKFCGLLLVDGKFIAVKGYTRKIPVIYGIDYLTHDIPHFLLAPSEGYVNLKRFFTSLRLANYPLQGIVSDDNVNIPQACRSVYPRAVSQLCWNHYKQKLRLGLGTRTSHVYKPFMKELEILFKQKRAREDFLGRATKIYERHKVDPICAGVMTEIGRRLPELLAYTSLTGLPVTNNLIESYNSHLEGRLKTIKGFQSFSSANNWLNSYFLKRRVTPFTDCGGKFKHLNKKSSLSLTLTEEQNFEAVIQKLR